jgi:hypothetical protein
MHYTPFTISTHIRRGAGNFVFVKRIMESGASTNSSAAAIPAAFFVRFWRTRMMG